MTTTNQIREWLEHSPPASKITIAHGLAGWVTEDNDFVCSTCTGRVMARGCVPKLARSIWHDTPGAAMLRCAVCGEKVK